MLEQKEIADWFRLLQSTVCSGLAKIDKGADFLKDFWERPGGGGGLTRVLTDGKIIERGGVNFSEVYGEAPVFLQKQYAEASGRPIDFFATGVSSVIHPRNPFVPIIHMNVRFLRVGNHSWFGGGIDLTPHYVIDDDASFFHNGLKKMCDKFNPHYYPDFKKEADEYFFIKHRNETRGIGGIFYDHLGETEGFSLDDRFNFVKATGSSFLPLYSELIYRNKDKEYDQRALKWQSLRRGRYVEFNLVYDRGTKFGLETDGRTESILMSLPPMAQWEYDFTPEKDGQEVYTLGKLRKGIDWAGL